MYNEIMDAVTGRISGLFPPEEGYTIYTDAVGQGLSEPCFFVGFLEPSEKPMVGPRYYRSNAMYIQYLPGEVGQPSREMNRVSGILMDGMEYIALADGSLLRGTGRSTRLDMEERMVTFFVSYNMFVYKQQKQEDAMSEIEIEKGLVK